MTHVSDYNIFDHWSILSVGGYSSQDRVQMRLEGKWRDWSPEFPLYVLFLYVFVKHSIGLIADENSIRSDCERGLHAKDIGLGFKSSEGGAIT